MKILAIGAHPDDIEYGCGGTLLAMKRTYRSEIHFFVSTYGEYGGTPEVRIKEQEAAADFLGVKKIHWGGFKDTQLALNGDLIGSIEKVIKEVSPDVVFVNYPDDTHQDHRNLAEATVIAARYCRKVLFYEDFTAQNFEPHFFGNIEETLEDKVKLLKFHDSQVERDYPTGLDILESVKAVANFRGFQAKVKYAEGFGALRYLMDKV
jgi:LmbE family N-acetylglucosaminyl deacetylase